MTVYDLIFYLASFCAVVFVFAPHEYAHAFVAYKNGDATAKIHGRLTLNPLKHIDPIGFVSCALVGFGWAKPVPVNPANFRNYKKGLFATAIAGVVVNYVIAFIAYALFLLILRLGAYLNVNSLFAEYVVLFFETFFWRLFSMSLCVFVFNLLPFYPLDGFRIVESLTRSVNPVQKFLREYGQVILIVLIVESFLCDILVRFGVDWVTDFNILNYILGFATDIIGFPVRAAWDWILTV